MEYRAENVHQEHEIIHDVLIDDISIISGLLDVRMTKSDKSGIEISLATCGDKIDAMNPHTNARIAELLHTNRVTKSGARSADETVATAPRTGKNSACKLRALTAIAVSVN